MKEYVNKQVDLESLLWLI